MRDFSFCLFFSFLFVLLKVEIEKCLASIVASFLFLFAC